MACLHRGGTPCKESDAMPPAPHIRQLTADDAVLFGQLVDLFHLVFENDHPTTMPISSLRDLLALPHFVAFGVFVDEQLVGGCTAYILPSYTKPHPELFVYDFAIHPDYQRRRLGSLLMQSLFTFCSYQHIPLIFVMAHAEDTHAVEFYRANGAVLEDVVNAIFALPS
ncbi:MAG: GNAT family N-acetyltransferase [Chloroflexi bacterium]|nr:GNAT family N-acetyltransferase [Chloroflexota bacterium]